MGTSGGSANDHSNAFCCGGTLGSAVLRDGVLCILSNNHVLARSGLATVGEDTIQPGLVDSGCSATNDNIVGDFLGDVVPLGTANVDVGLSTARSGMVDTSGAILDIGVPCASVQNAVIGFPVMKSGRTTGLTTGTVTSTNTTVQVQYQRGCGQGKHFTITYTNQIVTGNMSAAGDSGSLLLSNDGSPNPVGLLYAGSSSATIYNKADDVVSALNAGGHTFAFVGNNCLGADVDFGPTPSAREIEVAQRVKVENESDLFAIPGVRAVGIGAAEDNPIEAVIVVYLEPTHDHGWQNVPLQIDGVRVRVILTDRIVAQ